MCAVKTLIRPIYLINQEVDLGMLSTFGRTEAPQKYGGQLLWGSRRPENDRQQRVI